jgi:hypothetical protein
MEVVPLVTNRQNMANWPSTFVFDGARASNTGKYIDICNTTLGFNEPIVNNGMPVRLVAKLSNVTVYDEDIVFTEQTIRLGDLPFFEGFPLAKNSYWTFEITTVKYFSFNYFLSIQFSLVDVENKSDYLKQPMKFIPNSVMGVHAEYGELHFDAQASIDAELAHRENLIKRILKSQMKTRSL